MNSLNYLFRRRNKAAASAPKPESKAESEAAAAEPESIDSTKPIPDPRDIYNLFWEKSPFFTDDPEKYRAARDKFYEHEEARHREYNASCDWEPESKLCWADFLVKEYQLSRSLTPKEGPQGIYPKSLAGEMASADPSSAAAAGASSTSTSRPAPSSTKRTSLAPSKPAGPKAPLNLSSTALLSEHITLQGPHEITISSRAVLHPRSRIFSEWGKVSIGKGTMIGERSTIGGRGVGVLPIVIEGSVVVEPKAVVEGDVGHGTVVGVGVRIGRGARVGRYCNLAPGTVVASEEEIPDYTTTFGRDGEHRRCVKKYQEILDTIEEGRGRQIDVLHKTLVNHALRYK